MARAGLNLGVRELAALAKVSPTTITRLESGEELKERTVDAIQAALETLGAHFVEGGVILEPEYDPSQAPQQGM